MEASQTSVPSETGRRYWLRLLRPLAWWGLLVLVLFAYRQHLVWSERTRLIFGVSLENREVAYEAAVSFDGRPLRSGERIPLGSHKFIITHPKGDTFATNLLVWYGEHNLGEITLNRSMGQLIIQANPPASLLLIRGPEFAVTLTNTPGMTSSVPTDEYSVEAKYLHWEQTQQVAVYNHLPGSWSFTPRLGTLQLTCNQTGASFQILKSDNQLLEAGEFPSTLREVPAGTYRLISSHHGNQKAESIAVTAGITNNMQVEILYGAVILESDPPGAMVLGADGRTRGNTPLSLTELLPGIWRFTLQRNGFEAAQVVLEVSAHQTNSFQTNLISLNYLRAMNSARQYQAAADYDRALAAATDALQAKPDDPEALAAQNEAKGRRSLRQAEALGKQGEYTLGIRELTLVLDALPENEEAKQLLTDYRRREPEQLERQRKERLERPKKVYDALVFRTQDASLFDSHEVTTTKSFREAESAILDALRKGKPAFRILRDTKSQPETFEIVAREDLSTALSTSAGYRQCLIVGGQTKDGETQVFYRVLEFKAEAAEKFSIGNLIGAPVKVNYVPLHATDAAPLTEKMKAQLEEGTRLVTERIRNALGLDPTERQ